MKPTFFLLFLLCFIGVSAQTVKLNCTNYYGGFDSQGTLYSINSDGSDFEVMHTFEQGAYSLKYTSLVNYTDGKLYGVSSSGGGSLKGTIFRFDPSTNKTETLYHFKSTGNDGQLPEARLCLAPNGKFYGVTYVGGTNFDGTIFSFDPSTKTYTKLYDFISSSSGKNPFGGMVYVSGTILYGTCKAGGANNYGTLFSFDYSSNTFSLLTTFTHTNGREPRGNLLKASNGSVYGTTFYGGSSSGGTLFEYNPSTSTFTKRVDFTGTNGSYPYSGLIQSSTGKLWGVTTSGGSNGEGVIYEYTISNNTLTRRYSLSSSTNGSYPYCDLIEAPNGDLYGTAPGGGANGQGTLFSFDTTSYSFTNEMSFNWGFNGRQPYASLMITPSGKIFGMTLEGGWYDNGVLFEYEYLTSTYSVKCEFISYGLGKKPIAGMIKASNNKLYGTTETGGRYGGGVLFELDPATNTYTVKKHFNQDTTGTESSSPLLQAANGNIFGFTTTNGPSGYGTMFEYNPTNDSFFVRVNFSNSNGQPLYNAMTQHSNGNIYGTIRGGGTYGYGHLFEYNPSTKVFTVKYSFNTGSNGANPVMRMAEAPNGKLYGMTYSPSGVIFEYDPSTNTYTKKISFNSSNHGIYPTASLTLATNGLLYGTTSQGGANTNGVLFSYDYSNNTFTKLVEFGNNLYGNGKSPIGGVMQASNGNLYGTCNLGGSNNNGILYEYNLSNNSFTKILNLVDSLGGGPTLNIPVEFAVTGLQIGNVSGTFCVGDTASISYTASGNYVSGNTFSAELSDQYGSFNSPLSIGSVTNTTSGSIFITIPTSVAQGNGYRIRIAASNPAFTSSDNGSNITINQRPSGSDVTINANPGLTVCSGDTIGLSVPNASGYTYQWKLNNSNISGATNNNYDVSTSGNYRVVVSNSFGCSRQGPVVSPVFNALPTIQWQQWVVTDSVSSCPGGSVMLFVSATPSNSTLSWSLNNTNISNSGNSYLATTPGVFSVTATDSNNCASTTPDLTYYYLTPPSAIISPSGTILVCDNMSETVNVQNPQSGWSYQWYQNNAAISGATNDQYSVSNEDSYFAVVTDSAGCTDTTSVLLVDTVNCRPIVSGFPSQSLCQRQSFSLSYTVQGVFDPSNQFIAQISDGTGSFAIPVTIGTLTGNQNTGTISVTIPGNSSTSASNGYRIRVVTTNPSQTGYDNGVNLTINPRPVANAVSASFSPDTMVCFGNTITMNVSNNAALTYQWQRNSSNISGATNNAYVANIGGTYRVVATNSFGCSRNGVGQNLTFFTFGNIAISPATPSVICTGDSVLLTGNSLTSYQSYQWYKDSIAIPGAVYQTYYARTSGQYSIAGIGANNCQALSGSVTLSVQNCGMSLSNIPSNLCQAQNVSIGYSAPGTYTAGNVFTVQLSNASGNFNAAVNIGTVTSTSTTGTISVTIPGSIASGSGYLMRLKSSNPSQTGSPTSSPISISARPTAASVTPSATPSSVGCTGDTLTVSVPSTSGYSYQWQKSLVNISGSTNNFYKATLAGSYRVIATTSAGCTRSGTGITLTFNNCIRTALVNNINHIKVDIWPNPSVNQAFLKITDIEERNWVLSITDLSEREIVSYYVVQTDQTILLPEKSQGVYFIELRTDGEVIRQKWVVQ